MPLGKGPLTAEIYIARYNEMAKAMRRMDPTIKIGSCPFVEEALRDCGENVDFVSIHTYPGSTTLSEAQMFADISKSVKREVGQVKKWIRQYQPQREKQIEIAYTEWNLAGGMDNGRLFSALWSSIFLGELAKNGVAMANQWDLFCDLVHLTKGDKGVAKAEYYALSLWNNYMGGRLIPASSSNQTVHTYASRSDDAVTVMLINTDLDREAKVNVQLSGFTPAGTGEVASVTSREYYYNAGAQRMHWSRGAILPPLCTMSPAATFERPGRTMAKNL
jgi:alpha-L-arabinofuranosidase